MCETGVCHHGPEDLCTCRPVINRGKDILGLLFHVYANIKDVRWELDYTDIGRPESRRLCMVGTCRVCGGRLCQESNISDELAGDDLLTAVYRCLYQYYFSQERRTSRYEFHERFVQMFHPQDRAAVREWLEHSEESRTLSSAPLKEAEPVLKDAGVTIYTIVRTGTDLDHGSFPTPIAEGSYLSHLRAKLHLQRLICAEKALLDSRYDSEDQGEDYWEAYQNGWASALFSRLEILQTALPLPRMEVPPAAFNPADYLPECAECQKQICLGDEKSECEVLEKAKAAQRQVLSEERDALQALFGFLKGNPQDGRRT